MTIEYGRIRFYSVTILIRWACLCVCLLTGAASAASAQIGSGAIAGRVSDDTGTPIEGATIAVSDAATGLARVTQTTGDGEFLVTPLLPGRYIVRVEREAFQTVVFSGVTVEVGATTRTNVRLRVAVSTDPVRVDADAGSAARESSGLGQVVSNHTAVMLPLNGRSFITLATLSPAVALPLGSSLPRINGGRPRTNEYLFDGISVLQPEPGQVAFFPNIEAVQEFRVETNSPPAEFGRFNGGVVNLTTRAGTNTLAGTLFEFLRHEGLNARNYFASTDPAPPRFRRNQFGGVAGGPLKRNSAFFFVDYQGQRQSVGRTVISTVPTLLQRQGIFTETVGGRVQTIFDPATTTIGPNGTTIRTPFPNNQIPLDRFDPVARILLARYPAPTSSGTANNFRRTGNERVDQDQASVRLDGNLPGRAGRAFLRTTWFTEQVEPVTPLPDGSGVTTGTLGPQRTTAWATALNHQALVTSRLFHELRVGDTRRRVVRRATTLTSTPADTLGLPGIPQGAFFGVSLPTFSIAGIQQLGSPANTASDFDTSVTQVANVFTWARPQHTVRFGTDLRWTRLNVVQPPSPTGIFTFSALFTDLPGTSGTGHPFASFLLGQVQQFSVDLQHAAIRNRARSAEFFAQDDWRARPWLTVHAGLRYTLNFPSTEVSNQAAVFNLTTAQLDYLGQDGHPRAARSLHLDNLGPRLTLAATLPSRSVIRAGYGLVWIDMAGITTPFTTPAFPFLQTVSQRTLDTITPAFRLADGPRVTPIAATALAGLGQGVFAVDRDLGSGYVQQWHGSVAHEFTPALSIEGGYVGSKITHVGVPDANINQLTIEQLARGTELLRRVPNPYFGVIPRSSSLGDPTIPVAQLLKPFPAYTTVSLYRNNVGTTLYNGGYLKLEGRLGQGRSYSLSYTRSRLVDDASSVFDASILTGPVSNSPVADAFNRRLDRDVSAGDIPHALVASLVWDLLRDWTLSGIVTLQSGTPVAVTQATNSNAFAGFGVQRPNVIGNPTLPANARTVAQWFNTEAFSAAPQFTLGTSSRNPVRGPSFRNVDVAVVRRWHMGRRALELRAEAFNLLNRPALGAPNGVFGTPAFGTITTAGDPRVVQLAVKMAF